MDCDEVEDHVKEKQNGLRSPAQRPHQETKIGLPPGEPDIEELRSVTREWLVPLLVEKFLRELAFELRPPNVGVRKRPISDL